LIREGEVNLRSVIIPDGVGAGVEEAEATLSFDEGDSIWADFSGGD